MISEMQERVTQAILPAFAHIPDKEYRLTIAGCWARAAIEAMRAPTKEMIERGLMAISDNMESATDSGESWNYAVDGTAFAGWQAMIDAALAPAENGK